MDVDISFYRDYILARRKIYLSRESVWKSIQSRCYFHLRAKWSAYPGTRILIHTQGWHTLDKSTEERKKGICIEGRKSWSLKKGRLQFKLGLGGYRRALLGRVSQNLYLEQTEILFLSFPPQVSAKPRVQCSHADDDAPRLEDINMIRDLAIM